MKKYRMVVTLQVNDGQDLGDQAVEMARLLGGLPIPETLQEALEFIVTADVEQIDSCPMRTLEDAGLEILDKLFEEIIE